MRTLAAVACALALSSCTGPKPAASQQPASAQATPEPQRGPDVDAQLAAVEKDLAEAGTTGTRAGELYEKKGDLLASAGRKDAAIAAYDEAARAYGQSPEATTMPAVRSDRAREKAAKLRGVK